MSILLFAYGCSTEKNTTVSRAYHNTTAYYNGYFNAREIIREESKAFEKNSNDNFSKILRVNKYPDENQASSLFPPMERSIEKCSKVIAKHAMPNEKKGRNTKVENCKWIDENWLLIGVSHFYKREFTEASEKFKYIAKQYPKQETKYDAKLWLAKIDIENGDYYSAYQYLSDITTEKEAKELKETRKAKKEERLKNYSKERNKARKGKGKSGIKRYNEKKDEDDGSYLVSFPKELADDLEATYADYYIGKKEYPKAIESLEKAIELATKRRHKIRYQYILAQLYQKTGNLSKSSELYSKVAKKAPYQMAFYAKMNNLLASSNSSNSKKALIKLSKDSKYKEFRDQIFYALGNIEYKEGNKEQALEYYIASTSQDPASNPNIKGETYLRIADIYFNDKKYLVAKKYYDNAIASLPKDYDDLDLIKIKAESLNDLTKFLTEVQLQDSLLKLSSLSKKDQQNYVETYLKDLKEQKERDLQAQQTKVTETINTNINAEQGKGKFWAYNPSSKAFGYKEFVSKWGEVKLEDDWRRSNKTTTNFENTVQNNNYSSNEIDEKEIEKYLANIPNSEIEKSTSNDKILNSLYEAGLIYKENLKDYKEAVICFESNVERYSPDDKIIPSLFQLYKTYQIMGMADKAEQTKNKILSNYPNSDYAKIIRDPNYAKTLQEKSEIEKKEYTNAYSLYQSKRYPEVISKSKSVKPDNLFKCKYTLLEAYSYSNMAEFDSVKSCLNEIIKTCKSDSISLIAAKTLKQKIEPQNISNQEETKNNDEKDENNTAKNGNFDASKSPYSYTPTAKHYFLIVINDEKAEIDKIKNAIGDFNTNYFKSKSLRITPTFFDKQTQVLIVKNFMNRDYAQAYYEAFKTNDKELKDFNQKYEFFSISDKNFITLYNSKVISEYLDFFKNQYFVK